MVFVLASMGVNTASRERMVPASIVMARRVSTREKAALFMGPLRWIRLGGRRGRVVWSCLGRILYRLCFCIVPGY